MNVTSIVEQPVSGQCYYRQRIPVEGWVWGDYRHERIKRVSAHGPGGELGATTHLFVRPDVNEAQRLPAGTRAGFRFLATFPNPYIQRTTVGVEVRVEFTDGTYVPLSGIHIRILENDYTSATFGALCDPKQTGPLDRASLPQMAGPGAGPNPDCVALLADYLPAGASVLDVGCGVGAYCEPLRTRGFSWIGCDPSIGCLHELALHSRPHRRIQLPYWPWSRYRLPAADREFDAVLALDVLNHVRDPGVVLAEMARATRGLALFSVPNVETLPYLASRDVVALHVLEAATRRYFNRFNLRPLLAAHFPRVEIFDYGTQSLRTPDDLPLAPHLFAICEV
jgi:2-polyprenyl-3-methyl-5-hydroxy-6-metoxy-1,4-benzoquinol methylase